VTRRTRRLRALLAPALLVPALLVLLAGCHVSVSPPALRLSDPSLVTQANLAPCPVSGKPDKHGLRNVTLHCLGDGPAVHVAGLRGPAVVNVWFSNCLPCQKEAPILAKFAAEAGSKVLMLGVDSESYPNSGLDFVDQYNLHFAMLTDQHSDFVVKNFPSTYFLDAAGHLVGQPLSPITSLQQLEAAVRSRLGVTVS
jgi:thiol-disulfide isomerase/thioredoxin